MGKIWSGIVAAIVGLFIGAAALPPETVAKVAAPMLLLAVSLLFVAGYLIGQGRKEREYESYADD